MSAFFSPLLMSDEAILQLGVKPHDVELFRRRQYQFRYDGGRKEEEEREEEVLENVGEKMR
jgi:hypothetical protein